MSWKCPKCNTENTDYIIEGVRKTICLCGYELLSKKVGVPNNKGKIQNGETFEYICAYCNSNVGVNDTECPGCKEDLESGEINENELKDIINQGHKKAYNTLALLHDSGKKEKTIVLGKLFIEKYPFGKEAKWATKIIEEAKKLQTRPSKLKIRKGAEKYCPNCKRIVEINKKLCKCGYNFSEPNLEEIRKIKKKRVFNNRVIGIIMIFLGTGYLVMRWPSDVSQMGDSSLDKFIYGIPVLLIIFGIYKVFSGKTLKEPTGTPFDYILGDNDNVKDAEDDIPQASCPSCGQRSLAEMNYKFCPHCGHDLKSPVMIKKRFTHEGKSKNLTKQKTGSKKIAWMIVVIVLISILAYFALQIGSVAKESLHYAAIKGDTALFNREAY